MDINLISEDTYWNLQYTKFVSVAGLVALLYDHVLTFFDEIRLVHRARWTVPKALWLVNRYVVPALMIVHAYDQSALSGQIPSVFFCRSYLTVSLFLGMLSIAISNFLVLLRLWNLWERNVLLMRWTLAAFVCTQTAATVATSFVIKNMWPNLDVEPVTNTCVLTTRVNVASLWLPGIVFEVVVFATTWFNALQRPRSADAQMAQIVYRDGALYFSALFILRLINLALALTAPASLMVLGVFFIWSITNITLSRLVLNTRRLAHRVCHGPNVSAGLPELAKDAERAPSAMSFMTGDFGLSARGHDFSGDDNDEIWDTKWAEALERKRSSSLELDMGRQGAIGWWELDGRHHVPSDV